MKDFILGIGKLYSASDLSHAFCASRDLAA